MNNVITESLNIDDILRLGFGESENVIRCVYKKVVNIKPYETETLEVEGSIKLDRNIDGYERLLIGASLEAQAEYTILANLLVKGMISEEEFMDRRKKIEKYIYQIKRKAISSSTYKSDNHI